MGQTSIHTPALFGPFLPLQIPLPNSPVADRLDEAAVVFHALIDDGRGVPVRIAGVNGI